MHSHVRFDVNEWGEPAPSYKWTGLSLGNNWLKLETSGKLRITLKGIQRIHVKLI